MPRIVKANPLNVYLRFRAEIERARNLCTTPEQVKYLEFLERVVQELHKSWNLPLPPAQFEGAQQPSPDFELSEPPQSELPPIHENPEWDQEATDRYYDELLKKRS